MLERILCIGIGYLFGLFQTGYLYGRLHGIDIREHGSGNAGSTNALRTLGAKAGAITFLGDAFKCVFAVIAMYYLIGSRHTDMLALLKIYTGAGVILGHNYPFYLKFKGGKGVAATGGMLLSFDWIMTLCGMITFLGGYLITKFVSVGSLLVYVGFMIELVILGQIGHFGMQQVYLNEMYAVGAFLTLLAFYKHRENIKRLIKGTETKTYIKKK